MSLLARILVPLLLLSAVLGIFLVMGGNGLAPSATTSKQEHREYPAKTVAAKNTAVTHSLFSSTPDATTDDTGTVPPTAAAVKTGSNRSIRQTPMSAALPITPPAGPLPIASVLAQDLRDLSFTAEQRQEIARLADFFIDQTGDPATGSASSDEEFAQRVRETTDVVDSLIKQRYGHRAFVQMQRQATQELNAR